MRFALALVSTLLCAGAPAEAASAASGSKEAWFFSNTTLRVSTNPLLWCAFVTDASATAATKDDRFWYVESGWLRYRGKAIESFMVITNSEDSHVEDSYTFGPDLAVTKIVRTGHSSGDPYVTATFRPDAGGHLNMTVESRRSLEAWRKEHATFFLDWPRYATFAEIPFAGLIHMKSGITVSEDCQETKG
jgi:hypothetical protein